MQTPPYVWIPLGAAFFFAIGALMIKRAMAHGVGPWRVVFVANWMMMLIFLPLWLTGEGELSRHDLLQALAAGTLFFAGQLFTFLAFSRGDVSVTTPVLGTKVIFVALFTVLLLRESIPTEWWVAAVMISLATLLLRGKTSGARSRLALSIVSGFASAGSFALLDVLLQKWSGQWSFGRFVPAMFCVVAVLSFMLTPFFSGSLFRLPPQTWRWLAPGTIVLALQGLGMAYAIIEFGHATVVNVVYGSRGVWSVVLVWTIGHWFENVEREQGRDVMTQRLIGSLLVVLAIWLVTAW